MQTSCSNCQMEIPYKDAQAGRKAKCPRCQTVVRLPEIVNPERVEQPKSAWTSDDAPLTKRDLEIATKAIIQHLANPAPVEIKNAVSLGISVGCGILILNFILGFFILLATGFFAAGAAR